MTEKTITLPKQWSDFLLDQPETGMGYQTVSITLQDGRIIEDVAIIASHIIGEIRGQPGLSFDPKEIAKIEVTHRRWKFGV